MDKTVLSICIPTYNREVYLNEAVTSIIGQLDEETRKSVEICISDNASTDQTKELICKFKNEFPNITYYRWPENMGADRNFLKVVELAKGEYCWLLGSDDVIKKGAIKRILQELKQEYDIYLCNRIECNKEMIPISNRLWLSPDVLETSFDVGTIDGMVEYFSKARSIGAVFSYLSSIIVKRNKWNEVHFDSKFIGTAYSHVYILLSIFKMGCILKYIKESLILCRGNNDSFAIEGDVKRFMLDINGYFLLADTLYYDNLYMKSLFLRILTFDYPWYRIAKVRALVNKREWEIIASKLVLCGFQKKVISFCNLFGYTKTLIKIAIFFKRRLNIRM